MSRIKIIVDNSSDIPEDIAEKYNIGMLRILSIFGTKSYVPGVDITNAEFYDMLDASPKIPTTSQTPYAELRDYLADEAEKNDTVIYFTISAKASGQYNSARLACREIKEENPNADIRIVDSEKFSLYIANAAVRAVVLAEEGKSADEIIEDFKTYIKKWRCYLLVNDLKYLQKGGRVSKATAFVGNLLDIKPVLTIEHGLVESMENLRGNKKLIKKLIDKIEDDPDFDTENPEFLVVQSGSETGETVCGELRERFGSGCVRMYSEFGPIVGTHVGRNAFAVIPRIK